MSLRRHQFRPPIVRSPLKSETHGEVLDQRVTMSSINEQPEGNDNHLALSKEDQARVDYVVRTGVNSTDKKPFRPILLLVLLVLVVTGLSLLSQVLARWAGVY